MFLIHTLSVFTVIYAVSALLAETIFTSDAERRLPTAVRVGLGYFLSLIYFVSAWLFLSIRQAWALGIVLLVLYVYGKTSKGLLVFGRNSVRDLLKKHAKILGVFLIAANFFFLPLHLARHYGPFSEGGGDITVYSDTAKRLTDFNLTVTGLEESASLKERYAYIIHLINKEYSGRYKAMGLDAINPPNANYQSNKLAFNFIMNTIQYTPCAQYAFLSGENYPVFYGLLAFLYSLILASAWGFFRRFGLMPAVLSVVILGASHSLISVFYNMYLLQALSTTFLALTLAAVPFICLFSVAGLRVYGTGSAFVWLSYVHFLPLILPLLIIASFNPFYPKPVIPDRPGANGTTGLAAILCHRTAWGLFTALCVSYMAVGFTRFVEFAKGLISGSFGGAQSHLEGGLNPYFGISVREFSEQWWVYMFGMVSQQHFQPYAFESKTVKALFPWGAGSGFLVLAIGFLLMVLYAVRVASNKKSNREEWHLFVLYLALGFTVSVYSMVSQMSHYVQAKGAQYLLLYAYFLMLVPLALFYRQYASIKLLNSVAGREKRDWTFFCSIGYACTLFFFSIFLWIPRVVYANKIAQHEDRSTIVESSFFSEARRIKAEDKNAFVLFEPRKSADLYFRNQVFADYRIVPTRHLILQKIVREDDKPEFYIETIPSDFIKQSDLPHLWSLVAVKEGGNHFTWKAERLVDSKIPKLYFTGRNYEENFGNRPRANKFDAASSSSGEGMFSYVRHGSVMIYLPPGGPYDLEIKVLNRDESNFKEFDEMAEKIETRAAAGEFESLKSLDTTGHVATLNFSFEASDVPRLPLVFRYDSEYWFNVRLNGKEIAQDQAAGYVQQ